MPCGLGYFSNRLYNEVNANDGGRPLVTGIDISQTAVEKARKKFPEISFIAGDLTKENPFTSNHEQRAMRHKQFDLVVVKEVLWYVSHNLKSFMQNVLSLIKEDGFLYVAQSFPESGTWVGKEVLDSPERLKEILSDYSKPITVCYEKEYTNCRGNYLHYLGNRNYENK